MTRRLEAAGGVPFSSALLLAAVPLARLSDDLRIGTTYTESRSGCSRLADEREYALALLPVQLIALAFATSAAALIMRRLGRLDVDTDRGRLATAWELVAFCGLALILVGPHVDFFAAAYYTIIAVPLTLTGLTRLGLSLRRVRRIEGYASPFPTISVDVGLWLVAVVITAILVGGNGEINPC